MANSPLQHVAAEPLVAGPRPDYIPVLVSLAVLYCLMGFIAHLNDKLLLLFRKEFCLLPADEQTAVW